MVQGAFINTISGASPETPRSLWWNISAASLLLVTGLVITALVDWRIAANSFELWQLQSVADAERLSAELRYRVMRNREPLVAISSLYSGSDDVTQAELLTARQQVLQASDLLIPHSLAFVAADTNGRLRVEQVAGELAELPETPGAPLPAPLHTAFYQAAEQPGVTIVGALYATQDASFLPLAISARNNETEGVLLLVLDFSALLNTVTRDVLPPGSTFNLFHPDSGDINHARLPENLSEPEARHVVDVDMGRYTWQLEWLFDADYDASIDGRLVWVVAASGMLISALLSFVIFTLLQQKTVISRQILDKTRALESTQRRLVQREKMAALGQLVAGISHELNTPIGNSLLAASLLSQQSQQLRASPDMQNLPETARAYMDLAEESSRLIEKNILRANNLIKSLKQVAVDQSSERRRRFNLAIALDELLETLSPALRSSRVQLKINVPDNIQLDSYPGALYQVISNLISNALAHAFDAHTPNPAINRLLELKAHCMDTKTVTLQFADNGAGIPAAIRERIFEPFFTTRMGSGGSGLGLHIVYTLVTDVLGGEISLQDVGQGSCFVIKLPLTAPQAEPAADHSSLRQNAPRHLKEAS